MVKGVFTKGHIPWNKGLKGWTKGTRAGFQKGHIPNSPACKKGFKFSEEHKRKISQNSARIWLGKHLSPETKKKISLARKGKGISNQWGKMNKGKIRTLEMKKRYSETKKGIKFSEEHKRKLSEAHKGKHRSEEIKRKMSERRGEKSSNWKGGKTLLGKLIRSSFTYRQWRSDIFTRDNFTCQMCGKKGDWIEADHYPKGFAEILDEYKIKTSEEAIECQELWNINNGRTLCLNCHNKTKHGRKTLKKEL